LRPARTFAARPPAGGGWLFADKAIVLCLRIVQAVFVVWNTERGLMTIHR
jgi:hypothetical protein